MAAFHTKRLSAWAHSVGGTLLLPPLPALLLVPCWLPVAPTGLVTCVHKSHSTRLLPLLVPWLLFAVGTAEAIAEPVLRMFTCRRACCCAERVRWDLCEKYMWPPLPSLTSKASWNMPAYLRHKQQGREVWLHHRKRCCRMPTAAAWWSSAVSRRVLCWSVAVLVTWLCVVSWCGKWAAGLGALPEVAGAGLGGFMSYQMRVCDMVDGVLCTTDLQGVSHTCHMPHSAAASQQGGSARSS